MTAHLIKDYSVVSKQGKRFCLQQRVTTKNNSKASTGVIITDLDFNAVDIGSALAAL